MSLSYFNVKIFSEDSIPLGVRSGLFSCPSDMILCNRYSTPCVELLVCLGVSGTKKCTRASAEHSSCTTETNGNTKQIQVDENGKITESKFKTFGCGSAIASSSVATEWLKGRTVDESLKIKNTDIAGHLKLPPVKLHCRQVRRFWKP